MSTEGNHLQPHHGAILWSSPSTRKALHRLLLTARIVSARRIDASRQESMIWTSFSRRVTGEIRSLRSSFGSPEHAHNLPVSPCSFSPLQSLLDHYLSLSLSGIFPLLTGVSSLQDAIAAAPPQRVYDSVSARASSNLTPSASPPCSSPSGRPASFVKLRPPLCLYRAPL
jgi:hypothetical protein